MLVATHLETELQHTVIPFFELMKTVCKTGSVFIILHAIFSLKEFGEKGVEAKYGLTTIIIEILLGALIWNLTDTMLIFSDSIFGSDIGFGGSDNPLAYPQPNVNIAFQKSMPLILSFVYFFEMAGILSFVRGLFVFHQTTLGYKHSSFWKGFFHCLGGILAFHFDLVLSVLSSLFRTS